MKVHNVRREGSVDFTIPPKGDKPVSVVSIRAGESANVDLSEDDPQISSKLHTQQITIGAAAKAAAPAAKPAAS